MTRTTILAAAALSLLAVPAQAWHCPRDAAAIDHALANMTVSDEVRKQATELKDKGMQAHGAGDHRAAVDALAEGMRVLLMSTKK